jgi:hypothetical protein
MLFLIPFFTLLPDLTLRFFQKIFYPNPAEIISSNLLFKENLTFFSSMSSLKPPKMDLEESKEISKNNFHYFNLFLVLAKNQSILVKQEEFKKFENMPTHSPLVFTSKNENTNTRMNPDGNYIKRGSSISKIEKNNVHDNLHKDFLIEYMIKDTEKYNNLGQVVFNPLVHESKDFLKDDP